ncbi:hypothetical protein QZM97_26295 [Burkholderia orbicola]|uniref:hypothetical protein n=1 Tax=Burkholderia orbicola TaxID=2978683 RepID=UPI002650904B|nr:hypothetical protein [Burkholderia orbicola]MDN7993594.1 hypothetical protein [Burkholderia orbicola]
MKKILIAVLMWPLLALAQSYPSPTFNNVTINGTLSNANVAITGGSISGISPPIPVASGGTNASTATGAVGQLQYLSSGTGAVARTLQSKFSDSLSFLDFGADPTGSVAVDTAFGNFYTAILATHKCGYMPSGTYKFTSARTLELASISPKGICLYGDGQYSTTLDFTAVASSPALQVIDTANAGGGGFYSTFRDFGVKCNLAGTCLQLGKTDFSDALNEFNFTNLWVGNNSASASAIGIQVNYVLNTHFFAVIAANNGHGDAWQINAGAFNIWAGGSGTYGDYGYHLTAGGPGTGAIQGNTFIGIDHEVNAAANVKIDTNNAQGNTWIGGTFVYTPGSTYAFAASAGSDNTVISPMTLGYPSGTPTYANFFNGATGVSLVNKFGQTTLYGAQFYLSAPASSSRATYLQTNGLNRWAAYATGGTEPGSNVGSDYSISRYNDAGTFIDSPIAITRSTGLTNINDSVKITGYFAHTQQEIDNSYFTTAPATGGTVTIGTGTQTALILPSGTLASLTITLPACGGSGDADGSLVRYTTSQAVTSLTLNATSSSVSNPQTSLAAGQGHGYLCRAFNTTWYPLY